MQFNGMMPCIIQMATHCLPCSGLQLANIQLSQGTGDARGGDHAWVRGQTVGEYPDSGSGNYMTAKS
jgi:hypothetical protein